MAKRKKKNRRVLRKLAVLVLAVVAAGVTHWYQQQTAISLDEVPPYSGSPYVVINGNVPDFSAEELSAEPFEVYSPLDFLGRCGTACANVGLELMPTEERATSVRSSPQAGRLPSMTSWTADISITAAISSATS